MPQYLIDSVSGGRFVVFGPEAEHLRQSVRVRAGEEIDLFDGRGKRWRGKVEDVRKGQVSGAVLNELPAPEPRAHVALYLALISRAAFEDALEKCVELGIEEFHPIVTRRSARPPEDGKAKLERWNAVAAAASKQCARARFPEVFAPVPFESALEDGPGLLADPASTEALAAAPGSTARLFIGPEGGFTEEEAAAARGAGFKSFSLGATTLRAETAAVAACAQALSRP